MALSYLAIENNTLHATKALYKPIHKWHERHQVRDSPQTKSHKGEQLF